jgi:macrolide transport system ATP-binding/permease protein
METLLQDIRFSIRHMLKSPVFTTVAIVSLALGVGANVAIFSLVNTVLLRPIPVERPDEVVAINLVNERNSNFVSFSYPNYKDFRDGTEGFAGIYAHRFVPVSLSSNGANERLWGYLVSGNYFDVLGVRAAAGRMLAPSDDLAPGGSPVAVLSYGCWRQRFGADPNIVGKTILLNDKSFEVVGVAPEGFKGTEIVYTPELWAPMTMAREIEPGSTWLDRRGNGVMFAGGRLAPGVTAAQGEAALNATMRRLAEEYPDNNTGRAVMITPPGLIIPALRDATVGFAGVMMATVVLVLLVACTNLAGLLLARATTRRKEIATRLAIGSGRTRIVRQLLTESVMLSVAGGVAGILLAVWLVDLAASFRPPVDFPLTIELSIDWRVLTFALAISVATGIVFGLAPALQATRTDLVSALKDGASAGYRRSRLRNVLVVAQIALSLVLLVAAGLVVRTLQHVQLVGPGFDTERAVTMSVDLGLQGYDQERGQQFYRQMLDRVRELPGVRTAGLASYLPLSLNMNTTNIHIEGRPEEKGGEMPEAMYFNSSPDFFAALGAPMLAGRDFAISDTSDVPEVAVVNETFARQFWPGENAIGKRFSWGSAEGPFVQIVGIVADGKYFSLAEDPRPVVFSPLAQSYSSNASLVVRTNGDPTSLVGAVRRELRELDPNLPLFDVKTLTEHTSISLFPMRVGAAVAGGFGLVALALAALGVFGVMAYAVAQRTREIGVRMALGATPGDVARMIVRQGMGLGLVGLAIGLAGAAVLTPLMASVLVGVEPRDAATFGAISILLAGVVFVACYLPARRATRVDPTKALRCE